LVDTASSLRGKPRTPLHTKFYPVGHISLDQINEKKGDFLLDLPEEGVYWIKTFYVSKALRNKGIGRAAMDLIESMAIDEPLCAKTLAIDTAQKDTQKRLYREKTGLELAVSRDSDNTKDRANTIKSTNQEWYERRFYRLIHTEPNFYTDPKEPPVDAVFLRKDIT
jgi:GNAT superfamily N-acetyltransferase